MGTIAVNADDVPAMVLASRTSLKSEALKLAHVRSPAAEYLRRMCSSRTFEHAEIGTTRRLDRRVERGLLEAARYCGVRDQDLPATRSVVITIIMRYTVLVPGFAWATWAKTDLK